VPVDPALYRRHRFPAEIISHAVWLYYRFNLSHRDVEELLAERGIQVSWVRGGREARSATSARPSELPVQFSRRQLSPGVPLLAVVALHARDQLQKVDQAEFSVEL
jgi:hypothetical protein